MASLDALKALKNLTETAAQTYEEIRDGLEDKNPVDLEPFQGTMTQIFVQMDQLLEELNLPAPKEILFRSMSRITNTIADEVRLNRVLKIILKGILDVFPEKNLAVAICAFDESRTETYKFEHKTYVRDHNNDEQQFKFMKGRPRNGFKKSPRNPKVIEPGSAMTVMTWQHETPPRGAVYIDDVKNWPAGLPHLVDPDNPRVASLAYLPLMVRIRKERPGIGYRGTESNRLERVGIIIIQFSRQHDFSPSEKEELKLLSHTAASALYIAQLQERLRIIRERLEQLGKMMRECIEASSRLFSIAEKAANFVLQGNFTRQLSFTPKADFDDFVLYAPTKVTGENGEFFAARVEKGVVKVEISSEGVLKKKFDSSWLSPNVWANSPDFREERERGKWLWGLGYPLKIGGRDLGFLFVTKSQKRADDMLGLTDEHERKYEALPFLKEERDLLKLLADQLALLIEDMDRKKRLARKTQIIASILEMIASKPDLAFAELVDEIDKKLQEVFSNEQFYILAYDEKTDIIETRKIFENGKSGDLGDVPPYKKSEVRGLPEWVLTHRKTLLIKSDIRKEIASKYPDIDTNLAPLPYCYVGVPIRKGDQLCGAIVVQGPTSQNTLWESDGAVVEALAAIMGPRWSKDEEGSR